MQPDAVSVARHESELGWWEIAEHRPHPLIAPHVLRYTGYIERTTVPLRRLEAPFGGIVLILSFDERLHLVDAAGRDELHTSFTAGLSDGPTFTEHYGNQHGIQVDLTPPAARALLGVPLRELTNRVVGLDDVLGPDSRRLIERLYELPSWHERFALLDREIGRRLAAATPPPQPVVAAWRQLCETQGRAEIGALASELGYSRRRLSARFHEEFGLPPKTFARVLRFAEIAQACGYYDQAHLNRDFREFAGTSPSSYVGRLLPDGGGVAADEDVPFVQDGAALAA